MSAPGRVVFVEFVDVESGLTFARSELPVGQLPESFEPATTLHLGDSAWTVERAEPSTAVEFVAAGRLVLTVRRTLTMPANEILYSLPTICNVLPAVGPGSAPGDCLQLREDDWRQVELVSRSLSAAVNRELDAIQRIYEDHGERDADGQIFAFRQIHVRSLDPLAQPLPWPRVRDLLPPPQPEYGGVSFRDAAGVAVGSFAGRLGSLSWYGIVDQGLVSVLGLAVAADRPVPMTSLEPVLREFDLVLVDWCRCVVAGPDGLAEYARLDL